MIVRYRSCLDQVFTLPRDDQIQCMPRLVSRPNNMLLQTHCFEQLEKFHPITVPNNIDMDIEVTGYQQRLRRKNNGLQIVRKLLKKHTSSDRMIRRIQIIQDYYNLSKLSLKNVWLTPIFFLDDNSPSYNLLFLQSHKPGKNTCISRYRP